MGPILQPSQLTWRWKEIKKGKRVRHADILDELDGEELWKGER